MFRSDQKVLFYAEFRENRHVTINRPCMGGNTNETEFCNTWNV